MPIEISITDLIGGAFAETLQLTLARVLAIPRAISSAYEITTLVPTVHSILKAALALEKASSNMDVSERDLCIDRIAKMMLSDKLDVLDFTTEEGNKALVILAEQHQLHLVPSRFFTQETITQLNDKGECVFLMAARHGILRRFEPKLLTVENFLEPYACSGSAAPKRHGCVTPLIEAVYGGYYEQIPQLTLAGWLALSPDDRHLIKTDLVEQYPNEEHDMPGKVWEMVKANMQHLQQAGQWAEL